jgi:hypothetical protein
MIEETSMRPASSYFAQIQFQGLQAFLHFLFSGFLNIGDHNIYQLQRKAKIQALPQVHLAVTQSLRILE